MHKPHGMRHRQRYIHTPGVVLGIAAGSNATFINSPRRNERLKPVECLLSASPSYLLRFRALYVFRCFAALVGIDPAITCKGPAPVMQTGGD